MDKCILFVFLLHIGSGCILLHAERVIRHSDICPEVVEYNRIVENGFEDSDDELLTSSDEEDWLNSGAAYSFGDKYFSYFMAGVIGAGSAISVATTAAVFQQIYSMYFK